MKKHSAILILPALMVLLIVQGCSYQVHYYEILDYWTQDKLENTEGDILLPIYKWNRRPLRERYSIIALFSHDSKNKLKSKLTLLHNSNPEAWHKILKKYIVLIFPEVPLDNAKYGTMIEALKYKVKTQYKSGSIVPFFFNTQNSFNETLLSEYHLYHKIILVEYKPETDAIISCSNKKKLIIGINQSPFFSDKEKSEFQGNKAKKRCQTELKKVSDEIEEWLNIES